MDEILTLNTSILGYFFVTCLIGETFIDKETNFFPTLWTGTTYSFFRVYRQTISLFCVRIFVVNLGFMYDSKQ
jgi:hypothetical protein